MKDEMERKQGAAKEVHFRVSSPPITQDKRDDFCDACFTGNYPVEPPESIRKRQMELFIREVGERR